MSISILAALIGAVALSQGALAQPQERCFAETGYCISGRIRSFWEQNGGLPVFGLPIGPQQAEEIEGRSYQAQWFERNRLELHPENAAPSDVLLGRLGADRLARAGRDWQRFPQSDAQPGCRFFPETGHNVCGAFLARWRASGLSLDGRRAVSEAESLALFGLPLSDAQPEQIGGATYTVQWFERARLELHPELGATTVLLGLLGSELRAGPDSGASAVVDRTQDYETVGFPDQRKIVRDSRGALFVAYRKKADDVYRIFVARSRDGGATWQVLNDGRPIEGVGGYNQRSPAIAVGADDTLHVVWYGNDARHASEADRQIKYAQSRDGGDTWSAWANIAEVPGHDGQDRWQEHPALYVQGGSVVVVWEGFDRSSPSEEQIKLTRSPDGGRTWSAWQNIAPTARDGSSRPTVVASANGARWYVLAYSERGDVRQIVWTRSDDGGATWAPWAQVAPASVDQRHASLAVDSAGRLHAAWRQQAGGRNTQIVYATYDGGAWSAPAPVGPGEAFQFFPSIAVTGQNTVYIVWTETADGAGYPQDDPKEGRVFWASRAAGQAWGEPSALIPEDQSGVYASLRWGGAANGGNVDVVWMDTTDPQNRYIRHTRLGRW